MVSNVLGSAAPLRHHSSSLLSVYTRPIQRTRPGIPRDISRRRFDQWGQPKKTWCSTLVSLERLADRKSLLKSVTSSQRHRRYHDDDRHGYIYRTGHGPADIITSGRSTRSSKEDPDVVARYGTGNPKIFIDSNGAPRVPQKPAVARRLIEASCSSRYSELQQVGLARRQQTPKAVQTIPSLYAKQEDFPVFDQCVSALIEDLHQRGLADDCAVHYLGRIRSHSKDQQYRGSRSLATVNCALMAGGGMRQWTGHWSDRPHRRQAIARPVTFGEVYATLFHHLGVRVEQTTIPDNNGHRSNLVEDGGKIMPELV